MTAELRKLAHALEVERVQLQMLAGVPAEDLRTLRAQVGEAMFQNDRHYFARMAALTKTVPGCGVGQADRGRRAAADRGADRRGARAHRAAELVGRISESYLADVSSYMDAARAPEIIAAIPAGADRPRSPPNWRAAASGWSSAGSWRR